MTLDDCTDPHVVSIELDSSTDRVSNGDGHRQSTRKVKRMDAKAESEGVLRLARLFENCT
jgi:hypothetical protein